MLSRRIRPFLAHFVPGTGRDFASRGFTIFELMIVVLATLLIAALVVVHFRQVRQEAYRDAMLNDLRNYAIAQEMWHSQHNAYAMHPDTLGFRFSKDVSMAESFGDGRFWGLRVKHSKTDIFCELFGGEGIPAKEIEKIRIRCSDDQIPTPPGSGPGSGGDPIGDPGGGADTPSGPTAWFEWRPEIPNPGEIVQFDASGSTSQAGIVNYFWTIASDTVRTDAPTVTYEFPRSGDFLVRLIVTDINGAVDTLSRTVRVNSPPVADMDIVPVSAFVGDTIWFSALNSFDADQDSLSFEWEFEDGTTASGAVVTKPFSAAGAYAVRLTVSDGHASNTVEDTVFIANRAFLALQVAAGGTHTCALAEDNKAYCWGNNNRGQLGDGTTVNRSEPTPVAGNLTFVQIVTGHEHTCAIASGGQTYCWGHNPSGQLGIGSSGGSVSQPMPVSGGHTFRTLAAGYGHTCAIDTTNAAYCWGQGSSGQLGNNTTSSSRVPSAVFGGHAFSQITAGTQHTCGLTVDGRVYCWGSNSSGQLGIGGRTTTPTPVPTPLSSTWGTHVFTAVSAGSQHTCAISSQGFSTCWGLDLDGRLGNGSGRGDSDTPSSDFPVAGNYDFAWIDAGKGIFTCGLTSGGTVLCWGGNTAGQLGIGDTGVPASQYPVPIQSALTFAQISTGGGHACAISTRRELYCWGRNSSGELGTGFVGSVIPAPTPVTPVSNP